MEPSGPWLEVGYISVKHWSIVLPAEVGQTAIDLLNTYVGEVGIEQPYDFETNTLRIFGEHDPSHTGSQLAVSRLAALAATPMHRHA